MECWWPERGDMIRSFTGFKTGKGEKKKKSGTDRIDCCTSCGCEGPTCFFLVCKEQISGKRWELDSGRGNLGVSQSGRVAWATGSLT